MTKEERKKEYEGKIFTGNNKENANAGQYRCK